MNYTTDELMKEFCWGSINEGYASNKRLKVFKRNGDLHFVNYSTLIAVNTGDTIYLNARKYSSTTTKHQNRIRNYGCKVVEVADEEELLAKI